MRKTIILGTLAALFGFATLAQASDRTESGPSDATPIARAAANDSRGDTHEHDEHSERSRDYDAGKKDEVHDDHHDRDEADEHRDHR